MIKNKIDFKLVNISLVCLIIFLVYLTSNFWTKALGVIFTILLPFLIAFVIAYALYPLVRKFVERKIPKSLAVFLVILLVTLILVAMVVLVVPVLVTQTRSLFGGIVTFLKELSINYNINFKDVQTTLSSNFNSILEYLGKYIPNGAISFIGISISLLSQLCIISAASIYFLLDMDKIRKTLKEYFKTKGSKIYNYVATLDKEMGKYLTGFIKVVMISFFEYSIAYTIIGHPDAILLGALAAFGNLIPYFGGIFTNIIAAITAFVISPVLFIKTCILFMICSTIDGNVINPLVYGKTNKIHPLVIIIAVFAGGILFGVLGIVIALPTAILTIATFKYFKEDIIKIKDKHSKK